MKSKPNNRWRSDQNYNV